MAIEETDGRKRSRSVWNLEDKPYTWTEILSVHLEDSEGRVIYPNNMIYLKDSEGNILTQINRDRHIAAKKDNFGHYSNGILYETEYKLNLDIPEEIKNNAIFIVTGENILSYLREICSGSYFMWGTTIPYQLDFKLDGNILTIRDIKDEIIHVFREDREILDASYSISIENISNYITFTTKDRVIIMVDQDSINKYGVFEYYDESDFYDAESDYYAANLLRDLGPENEEIDCSIIGLFPEIGSKVRVILPSFGLDKEFIIQEAKIRIGPNGYGNSSLVLSKKRINRRWTIPFKNVMEINKMKVLIKRRR